MAITLQDFTYGDADYIAKLNANNAALRGTIDGLSSGKQDITERGAADGYAGLDGDGVVPTAQLPATLERTTNKNAANGYAGLGADGKLDPSVLPYLTVDGALVDMASFEVTGHKDALNGYCGLDASGHVAAARLVAANMPDLSGTYTTKAREGVATGVATLDGSGKVPAGQLDLSTLETASHASSTYETQSHAASTYETSAHAAATYDTPSARDAAITAALSGYAPSTQPVMVVGGLSGKPAASAVLTWFLPDRTITIPANLAGTRCKVGTNPTATATLSVQRDGSQVATIQIATDGTITLSTQASFTITSSQELTVVAPGSQDTTLADVRLMIAGTR